MIVVARATNGNAIIYATEEAAIADGFTPFTVASVPDCTGTLLKTDGVSLWWEDAPTEAMEAEEQAAPSVADLVAKITEQQTQITELQDALIELAALEG